MSENLLDKLNRAGRALTERAKGSDNPEFEIAVAVLLSASWCRRMCSVTGMREPYCSACEDSTFDHECPRPVECEHTPEFNAALRVADTILDTSAGAEEEK